MGLRARKVGMAGTKRKVEAGKSAPKSEREKKAPLPDDEGPEAAAEWADLSSLVPWSKNPRKNELAIEKVAASIQRFGFAAPLLARKENREIIAGHTRFEAARRLGLAKVPVRFLDLGARQAHLLALADNKLAEDAEWDDAKLAEVLREIREGGDDDSDLLVAGFDDGATDALLKKVDDAGEAGEGSGTKDGGGVQIARFRRHKLPLTGQEAEALHKRITTWLETKGQLHGFVGRLIR